MARTYTHGAWSKGGAIAGSLLFLLLGASCAIWGVVEPEGTGAPWLMIGGGLAMAALAPYWVLATFRAAVVLDGDAVTVRHALRERTLRRHEIVGVRAGTQDTRTFRVIARAPAKDLEVPLLSPDEAFQAWFADLPNLDFEDYQKAEIELLTDEEFGPNEAVRREVLDRPRQLTYALNLVGVGVLLWAFIFPRPYEFAIYACAAAPLLGLAVVATSRGAVSLAQGGPRADVSALMYAGLAIIVRAILDIAMIDWLWPWVIGAGVGAAATLVLWLVDRRAVAHPAAAVLLWVAASGYAGGVIVEANMLADNAPPRVYRAPILEVSKTGDSLTLAPWGPVTEQSQEDVGRALHDGAKVGDVLCMHLYRGALGFRWYQYGACSGVRG